ncbi:MAG TPA: diadenylate cyclase CdaA [Candidatus Limnocylindrales bacterium]|nr:diadenylate cyclase CdaA [Candidatus Limnocylindrales bacterium]
MPQVLDSVLEQVRLTTVLDVGITALLIYWLFSLIRGTSAVRLVIGVTVLFVVYFIAQVLSLRLLTQILQAGAVVGLFALVVVFQPELRRALDRIGRVGSLGWLLSAEGREADQVAADVARAAALLSADGHGALVVLERETGLEEIAETGVMIHGDLSVDLLRTIFTPRTALHDGAVIVRATKILAAGAVLPLAETTVHPERFGTRHRAALGVTEQTDAVVVVVSEENGQISLVQRAHIVRNLNEAQLARSIRTLLRPAGEQSRIRAVAAGLPAPNRQRLGGLGRPGSGAGRDGATERVGPPSEELVLPAGGAREAVLVGSPEDGRPARVDERTVARPVRPGLTVRSPDVGPRDEAAARSAGSGR